MRVKHLVASTAAAGALALGLAPNAFAAGTDSVVVQPSTVAPGDQVSVFGVDCTSTTGVATSVAFTAPIPLAMLSNSLGGVGTVSKNAGPGTWDVNVSCGGKHFTGLVSVCSCKGKPTPSPSGTSRSSGGVVPGGKVTRPRGGAATGDGASQASAAAGDGGIGYGAVLIAAGLGLGAVVLGRRRRTGDQG